MLCYTRDFIIIYKPFFNFIAKPNNSTAYKPFFERLVL